MEPYSMGILVVEYGFCFRVLEAMCGIGGYRYEDWKK